MSENPRPPALDPGTDEDAISAAQKIGGFGVNVGVGEANALYRLPDVDAVHAWLAALVG